MEIVGQVEIEDYCQKLLSLRWPEVPKWRNVRRIKGKNILERCGPIDLLAGGFPCQPFSHAGRRAGKKDKRNLWPEFARLIREIKPRWVLAENVPGLLSIDDGRVFGGILGDLAACGYDAVWDCVPASAVGAPHRRDRVWIVAYPMRRGHVHREPQVQSAKRGGKALCQPLSGREDEALFSYPKIFGQPRSGSSRSGRTGLENLCLPDWAGGTFGQPSPLTDYEEREHASLDDTKSKRRKIREPKDDRTFKGKKHASSDPSSMPPMGHAECLRRERKSRRGPGKKSQDRHLGACKKRAKLREVERDFCRMAHGVSHRMERIKGLGNGQVVQNVYLIGKRIKEVDEQWHSSTPKRS